MTVHDPTLEPLVAQQREVLAALGPRMPPPPSPDALLPGEDRVLPGTPDCAVRVIRPPGAARGVLLHFHGGGFTTGNARMGDAMNSYLARETGVVTVSVDYRLAPAHRHPAALDDCLTAARWALAHAQAEWGTDRLLIAGDSVGASLAALTLLQLRDVDRSVERFRGAVLTVGNYDFSGTPSQRQSTDALFLSPQRLRDTVENEFPGLTPDQLRSPSVSPLYAGLQGLPPAVFSVGTHDSVLDDSLFMAARWRAAGNEAELHVYPEAPHLFLALGTGMAAEGRRRIAGFVRRTLS